MGGKEQLVFDSTVLSKVVRICSFGAEMNSDGNALAVLSQCGE
jgi:hypothetical protein